MADQLAVRMRPVYFKVIGFFLVSAVLLAVLANTMADQVDGGVSTYHAAFTDVSGLRVGDDVRVAGVQVGKISDVEVDPNTQNSALVTFSVRNDQPLLSNASLVMRYQNLLGQRYLSLIQPERHGAPLPEGATVPVTRTSPGFDLTELLNGFRPLFDVLQPADVNKLSESVVQVLQGEAGTVADLLGQTAQLTNFLADRDALFAQVFDNLTPVLVGLAGQGDELQGTVEDLSEFMAGLAKERKDIGRSIESMSEALDASEELLTDIREPLASDVQSTKALLAMYAAERVRLGDSFGALGGLMDTLGRVMSYRDSLTSYFCALDIDLGGGVVLRSSDSPTPYSAVCR